MGNRDGKSGAQDETDVAEGVFAQIKHGDCSDDEMNMIAQSLEVVLSEEG